MDNHTPEPISPVGGSPIRTHDLHFGMSTIELVPAATLKLIPNLLFLGTLLFLGLAYAAFHFDGSGAAITPLVVAGLLGSGGLLARKHFGTSFVFELGTQEVTLPAAAVFRGTPRRGKLFFRDVLALHLIGKHISGGKSQTHCFELQLALQDGGAVLLLNHVDGDYIEICAREISGRTGWRFVDWRGQESSSRTE